MGHHHKENKHGHRFHQGMSNDCCGEDDCCSEGTPPNVMHKIMMKRGMPGMGGFGRGHRGGQGHHGSDCGCEGHSGHGIRRRFISKAEKVEHLEKYKDQLQKELAGLEEHIAELKKTDE